MKLPLLPLGLASLASAACRREEMAYGVDYYTWAQTQSQIGLLPISQPLPYSENRINMSLIDGVIAQCCVIIPWNRTFYDEAACTGFVEVVSLGEEVPLQIGMRFEFESWKGGYDGAGEEEELVITKMDGVVTSTGDWAFNATRALNYYQQMEPWDVIPEEQRDSRETLKAAADAYADRFSDTSVEVPFGNPCCRIEGGASTCPDSNQTELNTCNMGFPDEESTIQLTDREYVIDVERGVVQVMMKMGRWADSHLFRIERGKIRGVHTMTACGESGCTIGNGTEIERTGQSEDVIRKR